MEKLPYTYAQLNQDLNRFLNLVSTQSQTYWIAFYVQYVTGCRFMELADITRWQIVDSLTFTLQPEKGNNLRTFEKSILPATFLNMIQSQSTYFNGLTLSTGSYYFKRSYFGKRIWHEDKEITTHLFRHHICKKLYDEGNTRLTIKNFLGEVNIDNSNGYIDSDLMWTQRF
jgi:integrase